MRFFFKRVARKVRDDFGVQDVADASLAQIAHGLLSRPEVDPGALPRPPPTAPRAPPRTAHRPPRTTAHRAPRTEAPHTPGHAPCAVRCSVAPPPGGPTRIEVLPTLADQDTKSHANLIAIQENLERDAAGKGKPAWSPVLSWSDGQGFMMHNRSKSRFPNRFRRHMSADGPFHEAPRLDF